MLTLKEAGGGQSVPFDFRLAAISHRIMLRSQKFLTLSITILGTIHKGRLLKGVGRWVHQKEIY